ncbi:B3 DNA binding domain-containing protein [Artemisia annua]|uniref:B3 DNA binding domain-containing protein n=1 Tax=Artemisia annua TaxID=35608 RepID=A0A2U1PJC7_ARTAN|nr:B3 DNA binding domain-containing protein [Artemisia annua]
MGFSETLVKKTLEAVGGHQFYDQTDSAEVKPALLWTALHIQNLIEEKVTWGLGAGKEIKISWANGSLNFSVPYEPVVVQTSMPIMMSHHHDEWPIRKALILSDVDINHPFPRFPEVNEDPVRAAGEASQHNTKENWAEGNEHSSCCFTLLFQMVYPDQHKVKRQGQVRWVGLDADEYNEVPEAKRPKINHDSRIMSTDDEDNELVEEDNEIEEDNEFVEEDC